MSTTNTYLISIYLIENNDQRIKIFIDIPIKKIFVYCVNFLKVSCLIFKQK